MFLRSVAPAGPAGGGFITSEHGDLHGGSDTHGQEQQDQDPLSEPSADDSLDERGGEPGIRVQPPDFGMHAKATSRSRFSYRLACPISA